MAEKQTIDANSPRAVEPASPEAVLAAMSAAPRVTQEDAAELEKAIAEGRRAPAILDPFADEGQDAECS
jgi:hypothetical protein